MNTLDTIAAAYRARHLPKGVSKRVWWGSTDDDLREIYRNDVRIILGLAADAMHRAGPAEICSAEQAEAWIRAVAAEDGCPKS